MSCRFRLPGLLALVFLPVIPSTVSASTTGTGDAPDPAVESFSEAADTSAVPHFEMSPIPVLSTPLDPGVALIRSGDWATSGPASLAEALPGLAGVSAVRRSAGGAEPVIRGLGWERVQTRVGGVCVYGACPGRMDPPAVYFSPPEDGDVAVVRGIPSVAFGPGAFGGAIEISPDYERASVTESELHGRWTEAWDSVRGGLRSEGVVHGGNERFDLRLNGEATRFEDYESGDGTTVPAAQTGRRGGASIGWRPADGRRLWASWLGTREKDMDFPALPMDMDVARMHVLNAGWKQEGNGPWQHFEVRGGWADIDHEMSNRNKPNWSKLEAFTPSVARSGALEVRTRVRSSPGAVWEFGAQGTRVTRDATRTRHIVASGATHLDHLWPDTSQDIVGAYVETERELGLRTRLRIGGRLDFAKSAADAADDPGLGSASVRDGYVRFHGAGAADTDLTETIGSLQSLLQWGAGRANDLHVGAGWSMRAPGLTELYLAFGPGPGGFRVGNPTLAPEQKWALETGWTHRRPRTDAAFTVFAHRVQDYVLATVVEIADVNGDGTDDHVLSYRNVDAFLTGFEAELELRPADRVTIPAKVGFVRGWNDSDKRSLPEIPPLEGSVAGRFSFRTPAPAWVELASRFALRQPFVDPEFSEDTSPAWAILSVRGSVQLGQWARLRLGVENVLDTSYHEHLTREAMMPVGDLAAGDEVPAPGRGVFLSLRAGF